MSAHALAIRLLMSKGKHRAKRQIDTRRFTCKIHGLINIIAYYRYRKRTK